MSMIRDRIIQDVETYLSGTATAAWALGRATAGCDKLVSRLRRGDNIGLSSLERLEATMAENPDGIRYAKSEGIISRVR